MGENITSTTAFQVRIPPLNHYFQQSPNNTYQPIAFLETFFLRQKAMFDQHTKFFFSLEKIAIIVSLNCNL